MTYERPCITVIPIHCHRSRHTGVQLTFGGVDTGTGDGRGPGLARRRTAHDRRRGGRQRARRPGARRRVAGARLCGVFTREAGCRGLGCYKRVEGVRRRGMLWVGMTVQMPVFVCLRNGRTIEKDQRAPF